MENILKTGTIFKHYKGQLYEFLYIARHSETMEELVVYKALYGAFGIWVRPKAMFFETIVIDGIERPRFEIHTTK